MYLLQRTYLKWNGRDRGVFRTPKRWIPTLPNVIEVNDGAIIVKASIVSKTRQVCAGVHFG